ncbi:hypothetical protein [Amycolatopsis sacchari]|uniref:SLAC1 family transporter n=1 Tax=Amycolatopsis sacchari TaxID=115433 RepID=UPI003D71E32E
MDELTPPLPRPAQRRSAELCRVGTACWASSVGVLLVLVQAAMVPRYRRLRFTVGFWSFTFPLAAAVALAEEWLDVVRPAGWVPITGVLLALVTVFIGAIAARSVWAVARRPLPSRQQDHGTPVSTRTRGARK